MKYKRLSVILSIVIFSLTIVLTENAESQEADTEPPQAFLTNPKPDNRTNDQNPVITIQLVDDSPIDHERTILEVNGLDVTNWEETTMDQNLITHQVPEIFTMREGNQTVNLTLYDGNGNQNYYSWRFIVDKSFGEEEEEVDYFRIFLIILMVVVFMAIVGTMASMIYLKVSRDFNFIKFYKRHPIDKEKVFLYVPMVIGAILFAGGLLYWYQYGVDNDYFIEYLLIGSFFIFITSFTVYAQYEKRSITAYERAFSQLLFELADAMRGGIDPAKAIVELSETNTGILQKQLKIAAKNIKTGRPFEEVLYNLAKPTRSAIIMRYATLIGEASKIGGEIAQVVHRSAKDMDDMLKVKAEKRRQLVIQIFTIYISIGVLLAIMWMLIGMYPQLIEMDFSILTGGLTVSAAEETDEAAQEVVRMSLSDIKRMFFHLLLINSLGSGLIVGKLIDGRVKYGLVHSLVLMGVASFIFVVFLF